MEEELEAQPKQLDDVADFVASFAKIRADMTPDGMAEQPRAWPITPGSEPFQKECGQCHAIEGYTEGGTRDAPASSPGARPSGSPG